MNNSNKYLSVNSVNIIIFYLFCLFDLLFFIYKKIDRFIYPLFFRKSLI